MGNKQPTNNSNNNSSNSNNNSSNTNSSNSNNKNSNPVAGGSSTTAKPPATALPEIKPAVDGTIWGKHHYQVHKLTFPRGTPADVQQQLYDHFKVQRRNSPMQTRIDPTPLLQLHEVQQTPRQRSGSGGENFFTNGWALKDERDFESLKKVFEREIVLQMRKFLRDEAEREEKRKREQREENIKTGRIRGGGRKTRNQKTRKARK